MRRGPYLLVYTSFCVFERDTYGLAQHLAERVTHLLDGGDGFGRDGVISLSKDSKSAPLAPSRAARKRVI